MKSRKNNRSKKPSQPLKELVLEKVLVVFNKPLYQQLILEEKHPYYRRLLRQHAFVTQKWHSVYEQHQRSLDGVLSTLKLLGLKTDILYRRDLGDKKATFLQNYDLIVTVGGDGTVLETSHYLVKPVLLGVNAAPGDSTGALCAARVETFLTTIVDFMTGIFKPICAPRLCITVGKKKLSQFALNEVLFANRSPGGTSRYWIKLGKFQEEHKSSGVWMATGVGSTAAIHSAGGRKLPPDFQGFQYQVRELLKLPGQKFKVQSGLLTHQQSITLIPTSRQMALYLDGNHLEIPVEYGEKVVIDVKGKKLNILL